MLPALPGVIKPKPVWSTANPNWEECIIERKSLIPFLPLFPAEAEAALEVMRELRIVDAPGSPTMGESCAPWVFDFASAIFGAYDPLSGRRLIKDFFLLVSKKNSKALALNTPIPTPTGWTTMGELQPGDYVLGANGKPTKVLATSEVFYGHDCYRMTFSNGETVVADAGHLWGTYVAEEDSTYQVRTTLQIGETLSTRHGAYNHYLPMPLERGPVMVTSVVKVTSVPTKCITVDAKDHLFIFGETHLPTHNSTIAGSIMLTALVLNWRESGEFLILAPTVEVAQNAFNPVRDMIKSNETLQAIFQVQDHIRTITHRRNNATLKVVAADSATVSGKKAIGILVDELWEFGRNPQADNMLKEATGGLASRPEGFVIYLSTQADKPPQGVFKTKLDYARNVRDGKIIDPGFLPVIYEHPESIIKSEKHLEPDTFYMTNPNIGLSVDEEFLQREMNKSREEGQVSLISFLAKHLNVEIGLALRSDRWAGADFWIQQEDKTLTFERILDECEVICVGIDGGGLDDLLGLAVIGRKKNSKDWLMWTHAWAHEKVLELRKEIAPALLDFQKQGDLTIVKVMGDDVTELASYVRRVQEADLLYQAGLDPAGIGAVLDALTEAEVPEDKIIGVSQGWKLGGAIKTMERKLAEKGLVHCAQPIMNWCVGNARVEPRANSILITKQASGTAKIDPLMAGFNAVTLLSLNPPAQTKKFQMFVVG